MVALSHKEIRQRTPYLLVGLLLVNFGLMAWNAKDPETNNRLIRVWFQTVASPVQTTVATANHEGTGFFANLAAWRTAVGENEGLRQRVSELEIQLNSKQDLAGENERLKSLLELKNSSGYKTVAAEVVARDPSAWFNSVIVSAGSAQGVKLNMPVITKDGVVGRVIATSPFTSQVLLLTDDKSAAAAVVGQVGASNALGSVKGTGEKGVLEMQYVSGQETVNPGDAIYTTGQDKIYPAGLKVGEVVEVKQGTATSPHVIYVKSIALGSLQEVSVLLYEPAAIPAPEQALPNVKTTKKTGSGRK